MTLSFTLLKRSSDGYNGKKNKECRLKALRRVKDGSKGARGYEQNAKGGSGRAKILIVDMTHEEYRGKIQR